MYQTIFYMRDGSIITREFDSYPTSDMIEACGIELDDIDSYETHY